jgi:hypothetical protein
VLRLKLVNSIKLDVMQSTDHVINDDLSTNETVAVIKGTYQEVETKIRRSKRKPLLMSAENVANANS